MRAVSAQSHEPRRAVLSQHGRVIPQECGIIQSQASEEYSLNRMRDTQNAPGSRIREWGALLMIAGFAHASCAFAQIYKCTDADGRTAFSDKPCATSPGAAGSAAAGKAGVKQEVLRQPKSSAGSTSADAISSSWPMEPVAIRISTAESSDR